jgi:hypothetical protein
LPTIVRLPDGTEFDYDALTPAQQKAAEPALRAWTSLLQSNPLWGFSPFGSKGNDVMTKTHAVGAAVTYGRRYLLTMIFNIAIGDDTDGNTRAELIEGSNTITPDEFIFIRELIETHGADEALVLKAVNATDLETMTQKQYREAVSRLKAWVKKKAVG